jgi:hypothetical protein
MCLYGMYGTDFTCLTTFCRLHCWCQIAYGLEPLGPGIMSSNSGRDMDVCSRCIVVPLLKSACGFAVLTVYRLWIFGTLWRTRYIDRRADRGLLRTGCWGKITRISWQDLRNEHLHDLCSPNVIGIADSRRMSWARRTIRAGKKRNTYRVVVGKIWKRLRGPNVKWADGF